MAATKKNSATKKVEAESAPTPAKTGGFAAGNEIREGSAVGMRMSAPQLWRFDWECKSIALDCLQSDELPLSLHLGLSRPAAESLMVELMVSAETVAVRFAVAFRAEWTIESDAPQLADLESLFAAIATQLGPAALYPFLRETVVTASVKSGLAPLMLPLVNFRDFFGATEIQIPAWEGENSQD